MKFEIENENLDLPKPMTEEWLESMPKSVIVSPRVGNNHGYETISDDERQQQVEDTEACCAIVDRGLWPGDYLEKYGVDPEPSPLLRSLRIRTAKQGALWVKADHPFHAFDKAIRPWAEENVAWARPVEHKGIPFVESIQREAEAHTIIARGLNRAFDVKYDFISARPWQMSNLGKHIEMYPTADHPEEPAGHGGVFGASYLAFKYQYSPNEEELKLIETFTKQLAMFRSFAWQHIPHSNLLGWKIGSELNAHQTIVIDVKEAGEWSKEKLVEIGKKVDELIKDYPIKLIFTGDTAAD